MSIMNRIKKLFNNENDEGTGTEIRDIAVDRNVLRGYLQRMTEESQKQFKPYSEARHCYVAIKAKFEYVFDSNKRECKLSVYKRTGYIHVVEVEIIENLIDVVRKAVLLEDKDINKVEKVLNSKDMVDKLYDWIYHVEEGNYDKDVIFNGDEPLWKKYNRIWTLHLPESLRIPSGKWESPFASYQQRPFVWAAPTKYFKVKISQVDNQSEFLTIQDGVLYSKDMTRLIFCLEDKEYFTVPDSVTCIDPFAFCLQKRLRNITLHGGINIIGAAAFMGCESLETFTVPQSVTEIFNDTFDGCKSMKSIQLHNGITSIGSHAFRHCEALESVSLPAGLTHLDSFECCYSLRAIDIPGTVETIDGFMFCRNLRKVTLHERVRNIHDYAFRFCDNLEEINFPEGLEGIGARAFYPSSIRNADFPRSLKKIGAEAFYYNEELSHLKFRSAVEVEECAFACCKATDIEKPKEMTFGPKVFVQDTSFDKFCFWD